MNKCSLLNSKTTRLVVLLFIAFFSFFCTSLKIKKRTEYALLLIVNYPVVNMEGPGVTNFNDSITIYYSNSNILYRLPSVRDFSTNTSIKGTEKFFVYKNDKNYGRLYNSIIDTNYTNLRVDSFLSKRAFAGTNFDLPDNNLWAVVYSEKANKNILIEKYAYKKSASENSLDSIEYKYNSSLNDIEFSFSSKLDKLRKMKLCKIDLVYNPKLFKTPNIEIPKRHFSFEIKETNLEPWMKSAHFLSALEDKEFR